MSINERDVETKIDKDLKILGYIDSIDSIDRNVYKQQCKTPEQNKLLKQYRPDYILYQKQTDTIIGIIEAKRPNFNLQKAIEQAKEYALRLNCSIVFATDGYHFKSLDIKNNTFLSINNHEINNIPAYDNLLEYQNTNDFFNEGIKQNKEALIKFYKQANDILKNEGFSAGIDRFSEFANLIFYKIILESENNFLQKKWSDIKITDEKIIEVINTDIKKIENQYGKVFKEIRFKNKENLIKILNILNKINFSLTETDYKGDAFEYFIHSYTKGAKNDLGQYFTPRHIVRMCVSLLDINKKDKIYDPFCGTGGMLIEAFRYLRNYCNKDEEIYGLKNNTIYGNEITDASNISKMNMICVGDGHNNINKQDSYKNIIKNEYQKVITNIPFSQHTDHYNLYNTTNDTKKNGDIVGILHCLEAMDNDDPNACCVIIVPIGILYKKATQEIRKYIYDNYLLDSVIELHEHVFQPYTMQHTAILKIKNKIENSFNQTENYFKYFQINNDGYSKNTYRIKIKENDIDSVINDTNYQKIFTDDRWRKTGYKLKELQYNININNKQTNKKIGDVCEIIRGTDLSPNKTPNLFTDIKQDNIPFYMAEDLSQRHVSYSLYESRQYLKKETVKEYQKKINVVKKNSTLLVISGQSSLKNHRAITREKSVIASPLIAINSKDEDLISNDYLFAFFLNFDFKNITYDYGYPGTTNEIIKNIQIPIKDEVILNRESYIASLRKNEIEKEQILAKMSRQTINAENTNEIK